MEDDSHGFEWGVAEGMSLPITTPSDPGLGLSFGSVLTQVVSARPVLE